MPALVSDFILRSVLQKLFRWTLSLSLAFWYNFRRKMLCLSVLISCLLCMPQGRADPRTSTRRYKPVIQVTEEIDINDITFTTSAPEFERSSSHKTPNYYNGIKAEGISKGGYSKLGDTSPSVFPYKDGYRTVEPLEKIYSSEQPLVVPAVKYKPYKVFKVQDGFSPILYKSKPHDKSKLLHFDPPKTYTETEGSKRHLSKILPYSSQLSTKPLTGSLNFPTQDIKSFVPSPTLSPAVLTQTKSENRHLFPERQETKPFSPPKAIDWTKSTKKPFYNVKKTAKSPYGHHSGDAGKKDFSATAKNHGENLSPSTLHKESPQQSESFLSEISTLHKGGSNSNNVDGGIADSLDLKTGERVEFQMYGMDGPQSYKFGFDTGKGQNRHFRFEERDNEGKVKGHYGYLDEEGKMRIMKYEADPITGFHAGPIEISPDDN